MTTTSPQPWTACPLPASLKAELRGPVAVLTLNRAEKRNALNDPTVAGIEQFFRALPETVRAVVLAGDGDHFSAGLDLSELKVRDVTEGIFHSRSWYYAFEPIEFGKVPVVAALKGAVVGGGLELASTTHIRVAEKSTFYALPEGQRGIYVGGGGSVRISRLIGTARMMDMMLTGRTYGAEDGRVLGFSQYVVENGEGLGESDRDRRADRGQYAAHQFRGDAGAAAHGAGGAGDGLPAGIADGGDRAGRQGGEGTLDRLPGEARGEGRASLMTWLA